MQHHTDINKRDGKREIALHLRNIICVKHNKLKGRRLRTLLLYHVKQ